MLPKKKCSIFIFQCVHLVVSASSQYFPLLRNFGDISIVVEHHWIQAVQLSLQDSTGLCNITLDSSGLCNITLDISGLCNITQDRITQDSAGLCKILQDSAGMHTV